MNHFDGSFTSTDLPANDINMAAHFKRSTDLPRNVTGLTTHFKGLRIKRSSVYFENGILDDFIESALFPIQISLKVILCCLETLDCHIFQPTLLNKQK